MDKTISSPSRIFFFLFCICWNFNYLTMTELGAMRNFEYAFFFEIWARFCWLILGMSLFLFWNFQNKSEPFLARIKSLFLRIPQKAFFSLLFFTGLWFVGIGVYHKIYVEPITSAFTLFVIPTIAILGIITNTVTFSLLLQSSIIGTAPYFYLALILKLANIEEFLGFQNHFYQFSWGLFQNPNAFGSILMTLLAAHIGMLILFWKQKKKGIFAFYCLQSFILLYLLYFTYHRSALLVTVLVSGIFLLFNLPRKQAFILIILGWFGLVALYQVAPHLELYKWKRVYNTTEKIFQEGINEKNLTELTSFRASLWKESFGIIGEHPFLGTGRKTQALGETQEVTSNDLSFKPSAFRDAHSSIIHLGEIYGLPAVFFFFLFHGLAFFRIKFHWNNKISLFLLGIIFCYSQLNGGLLYSLQFSSVFYLFVLSLVATSKETNNEEEKTSRSIPQ